MKLRFSIGPAGCRSGKVLSDCMMYFSNHTIAEIYIIVAAPLVLAVTPTRVLAIDRPLAVLGREVVYCGINPALSLIGPLILNRQK